MKWSRSIAPLLLVLVGATATAAADDERTPNLRGPDDSHRYPNATDFDPAAPAKDDEGLTKMNATIDDEDKDKPKMPEGPQRPYDEDEPERPEGIPEPHWHHHIIPAMPGRECLCEPKFEKDENGKPKFDNGRIHMVCNKECDDGSEGGCNAMGGRMCDCDECSPLPIPAPSSPRLDPCACTGLGEQCDICGYGSSTCEDGRCACSSRIGRVICGRGDAPDEEEPDRNSPREPDRKPSRGHPDRGIDLCTCQDDGKCAMICGNDSDTCEDGRCACSDAPMSFICGDGTDVPDSARGTKPIPAPSSPSPTIDMLDPDEDESNSKPW